MVQDLTVSKMSICKPSSESFRRYCMITGAMHYMGGNNVFYSFCELSFFSQIPIPDKVDKNAVHLVFGSCPHSYELAFCMSVCMCM